MKEIENNIVEVWFEDGIVFLKFQKDTILDLETIKRTIKMTEQFSVEENKYVLVDITNLKSVTTEARKYAAQQVHKYIYARAVLVNSYFTKFLFTSYLKFSKPDFPFAVFTNKEDAVAWLNELKAQKIVGHSI